MPSIHDSLLTGYSVDEMLAVPHLSADELAEYHTAATTSALSAIAKAQDAYFKMNVLELHEVLQDSARPELAPEPRGGPFNMH